MVRILPLIIFLAAPLTTGCARDAANAPEHLGDPSALAAREMVQTPESLFRSDQAVLSNEDIGRIFQQKVTPPAKVRLAVLRLGNPYPYRYYAPELAALEPTAVNDVLARFRGSPRVAHAMVMPSMLTPP